MIVSTGINITSVFVSDFIGILMLTLILSTRGFVLPTRKNESNLLFVLIIATLIDCLVDPFAYYCDARPGVFNYTISFIANSILYIHNFIVGAGVLFLVSIHIHKKISHFHKILVSVIFIIEATMLIVNIFKPIIFKIDENNVYHRLGGYMLFIMFGMLLVLYGLVIYIIARVRDGSLRYFPVWEFLLPITFCIIIQTLFYGISIQPTGFALSFTAIVISMQHESLYIDKLTGAYNRYELDKLIDISNRKRKRIFAAIMLDLNDFKRINDTYSHTEGDNALIVLVNIITNIIQNNGVVIRFAGDEFIVIINKADENTVSYYSKKINDSIEEYNKTSEKPYQLSVAIGGDIFDISDENSTDFMKKIDQLMYINKSEYYKTHDRRGQG